MQNGLIPNHYFADDADDLLQSYVSRYLAEEIIAEGVSRNIPTWTGSVKRKAMATAKFYFFDMGVVKALRRLESISESGHDFGDFFEHFLFLELRAWIDYNKPTRTLHYWRSTSAFEVDFVLDGKIAIEAKSSAKVSQKHFKGLKALQEENCFEKFILVCREKEKRLVDGILVYPWESFINDLWDGKILP